MAEQEVVSSRTLSQPVDSKSNCRANSCAYSARESTKVQPQITGMSHNENDLSKNDKHIVSDELDEGLHACSLHGNTVSSENITKDSCSDADDVASNEQGSYAPFGYPPCLRQIVQSALSVLDFGGVSDNVLHNSVTCEYSKVNGSDVSESAICNKNNSTKMFGGYCTENNEKQVQLADG